MRLSIVFSFKYGDYARFLNNFFLFFFYLFDLYWLQLLCAALARSRYSGEALRACGSDVTALTRLLYHGLPEPITTTTTTIPLPASLAVCDVCGQDDGDHASGTSRALWTCAGCGVRVHGACYHPRGGVPDASWYESSSECRIYMAGYFFFFFFYLTRIVVSIV
jgi:hypothetical protein